MTVIHSNKKSKSFWYGKHSEPNSGIRPSSFFQGRPLSPEDPYLYSKAVYFQIISGMKYLNINKLTVQGIFGEKDYQCRKMRVTNEFFVVDSPQKSQIIKNYLVLAKKSYVIKI